MKKNSNQLYWVPIPNNPRDNELYIDKKEKNREKKFNKYNMLFGSTQKESLYGYRQTASGRWRSRDEPDGDTQLKQSDAINKMLQKRKALSGRERLKTKGAVPTKFGKRLFEDFCRIAYRKRTNNL